MAVSWPKRIKPDATPRPQFHHVIDVVPTIYEAIGIIPPKVVNGIPQDEIDGVSMVYSFNDAKAKGTRRVLSRFGAFVRTRAKTSIRKKKGTSPPGSPPYSHVGLLRKFILFAYDPQRQSVVIGPTLIRAESQAPRQC